MVKNALLNKLRSRIESLLEDIARRILVTGITPNELTTMSLIIAISGYILITIYKLSFILSATILFSGLLDAVDGALARVMNKTTRKGAFLDSFFDRLCEMFFTLSLIELGFDSRIVLLYLALAMLVSYARARGESLGVELSGVGLMERAERLIALLLVSFIVGYDFIVAFYFFVALTALTAFTVLQRFVYLWKNL